MKPFNWLLILLLITTFSCSFDKDDRLPFEVNVPDDVFEFVGTNGESNFTGIECEGGSGDYNLNEDLILEDLQIEENLPEFYDLSEYLPPVGDQGRQGSCTAWAVGYYMKSLQERLQLEPPYPNSSILSPAYIYNQITAENVCGPTAIASALNLLQDKGVCSLDFFPYEETDCSTQPTENQNEDAETNKISEFKNLSGENMVLEMKTLLFDFKTIIISTYLSSEFGKEDEFGLVAYREHNVDYSDGGCHAMLVVGYSDEYNAFKVVNSWGENWGEEGFIWIDYKAFDNVQDQSQQFRVINGAYVAFDIEV